MSVAIAHLQGFTNTETVFHNQIPLLIIVMFQGALTSNILANSNIREL